MWKRKQSKQCIEFFNGDPSVIETFPIIESKDFKLNWAKRVREDYQKQVKKGDTNQPGFIHVSRCPGIFDLFRYGYIIPLPKDIMIKPRGKEFDVAIPSPLHADAAFGISSQSTNLISKPPWAQDFIVKIDTGWNVIAPGGVKFLMVPIAYPDTFDFTATAGVLDPAIETAVNFQMFWNATETETLISAGTPLGCLIPLSEKKHKWVQRTMNQKDRDWIEKLTSANSSSFFQTTMRGKIVDMYNRYWKN